MNIVIYVLLFFLFLSLLPWWVLLVPLVIGACVCVLLWKRGILSNTFVAVALLTVTILAGLLVYVTTVAGGGKARLTSNFGRVVDRHSIVCHQMRIAGLGDTDDFWQLSHIDANDCQRIIKKFNLEPIEHNQPSSLKRAPSWWPTSTDIYSVYQGHDEDGGCIELWIPKEDSNVYLFKFTE